MSLAQKSIKLYNFLKKYFLWIVFFTVVISSMLFFQKIWQQKKKYIIDGIHYNIAHTANMRSGPNLSYPVLWKYSQIGTPLVLEKIQEQWAYVRDIDDITGWIFLPLINK